MKLDTCEEIADLQKIFLKNINKNQTCGQANKSFYLFYPKICNTVVMFTMEALLFFLSFEILLNLVAKVNAARKKRPTPWEGN